MNRITRAIGIKGTLLAFSLISTVVMADGSPDTAASTIAPASPSDPIPGTPTATTSVAPAATPGTPTATTSVAPAATPGTATPTTSVTPEATSGTAAPTTSVTPEATPGTAAPTTSVTPETTPGTAAPTTSVMPETTPGTATPTTSVTPETNTSAPATTAPATTTPAAPGDKSAAAVPTSPTQEILPEQFKVYYDKNLGIARKSFKTSTEKVIPNNNEFTEASGCYLSCYSKNPKDAIYPVDTHVFLIGQIRVQGHYNNGLCLPKGFENQDIRTAKEFKAKCEEAFPERCEKESCWANGNTGNWF